MSDSCCSLEFAKGGVITESSVNNSQITTSLIQASKISASDIELLASIDEASASVIATAISKLSPAQLKALAEAIHRAHDTEFGALEPSQTSEADTLPTNMVGYRTFLLGEPDAWETRKDGMCSPVYRSVRTPS